MRSAKRDHKSEKYEKIFRILFCQKCIFGCNVKVWLADLWSIFAERIPKLIDSSIIHLGDGGLAEKTIARMSGKIETLPSLDYFIIY